MIDWFNEEETVYDPIQTYWISNTFRNTEMFFARYWAAEEMADSMWWPKRYNKRTFNYLKQLLKKEWFR